MASRAQIRDAIYSELTSLAGTYNVTDAQGTVTNTVTLEADDIGLREPEKPETLPQIVYHETYQHVEFNGVGNAQHIVKDDTGVTTEAVWREYQQAQFIIDVRAANEVAKEPIYESLHRAFQKYQFPTWNVSSLHDDIIDIEVSSTSNVDTGTEDVIRGDQVEVELTFHRDYSHVDDIIQTVTHDVDDSDGTNLQYYTTN